MSKPEDRPKLPSAELTGFAATIPRYDRSWLANALRTDRPPYWRRVWNAIRGR